MSLQRMIASRLPPPALRLAKRVRRRLRPMRWERTVARDESAHFDREALARDLRALGVRPGRDLIVHSAMSRLGFLEGGAEAFIGAVRDVVGPEATILMPCYPMKRNMLQTMEEDTPFHVAEDESTMGKITRVFRVMPGTMRSAHPTHSVAASGPRAREYTERHHLSLSPCGPGSPFLLLAQHGGDVLCVGTGVGKVTNHHNIEDLVDDFPMDVYLPGPYTKAVVFPDGREEVVEVKVHDPQLAPLRVDNHGPKEQEVLERMRRLGIVEEGLVGRATTHRFGAAQLDEMHREGLRQGLTIYAR